ISYVTWENTAPTISNPATTETGNTGTTYSRQFNATDPDTNQTLVWSLNSSADFLTINSMNRTAYVNGTLPSSAADYWVNVTVGDEWALPSNATDSNNYTLSVTELVGAGTIFDSLLPVGLAVSGFMLFFGLYAHTRPGGKTMGQLLVFIGGIALIYTGFDYQLSIQDAEMALMIIVAGIGIVALSAIELAQSKR
ncbi:MAG: hypothetical protein GTO14_03435, partial [Anaerolineales bacterium]|nr:hypothetical protein [Anaerolineales bacterium]